MQKEITIHQAYFEMRRQCSDTDLACYPVDLLIEWDEVRMKLNPNAVLSYAQEIMLAQEKENREKESQE